MCDVNFIMMKKNWNDKLDFEKFKGQTVKEVFDENGKALSIEDVMAMLPIVDLSKVNRVEVIDEKGRSYVNWKPTNKTSISIQDDGRTIKVFIGN